MTKLPDPDKRPSGEAVLSLLSTVMRVFFDGWILMVAIGLAHSCHPSIPTFGYWPCVFFAVVLASLAASGVTATLRLIEERLKRMGRRI